ncbi:MAG: SDR family oxidoreductase [Gammaproteobacteria bacterium]
MELKSRVAVITGAGRGIGRAIALRFARHGANIALLDLDAPALEETRQQCADQGVTVRAYTASVAKEDDVTRTMDSIVTDFGSLDVLINNAGIIRDALLVKAKEGVVASKMSLAQWQAVIDVNLTGVFLCGREAAERMIKAGKGGVIVNISSLSRHGNAGQTNYSAAKAGVSAMAVVWAKELARFKIRAASIAPGFIATDIVATMRPEMLEKALNSVPLHRPGTPDEVAGAAQFIVENDFFTGRCIDLDGGMRV